jgi:hypothetical protein
MVAGFDRHDNVDAEPDLVLIDQRHPFENDAVGFQPLNALPARRRRQPDPLADLRDGQRCILLQNRENLAVDGIHSTDPLAFRVRTTTASHDFRSYFSF